MIISWHIFFSLFETIILFTILRIRFFPLLDRKILISLPFWFRELSWDLGFGHDWRCFRDWIFVVLGNYFWKVMTISTQFWKGINLDAFGYFVCWNTRARETRNIVSGCLVYQIQLCINFGSCLWTYYV